MCVPTAHTHLHMLEGADFEMDVDGHTGHGRVLWTDYNYALIYECSHPHEDGSCDSGHVNIAVYGRSHDLPDSVKQELMELQGMGCVSREDFERIPHEGIEVFHNLFLM